MASGSFPTTEKYRQYIRQAGYVSLWFFIKFIAGYSGPFDLLNNDLHVDMANYRQTLLKPGCRGGMFIFRGGYKSTIVTEGGTAWELLRNPELRIRITNAISDKAQDFMLSVKSIYDSNSFFDWLYGNKDDESGNYVPILNADRWNRTELVLPNRIKTYREASVEYGGIGGASEGHHYDLHVVDDMIGLAALNSMLGSNAVMDSTRNWFWGSEKTLLVSMRRSRVIVVGTRYAVDDVYDEIIRKAKVNYGYPLKNFLPAKKGKWEIYYRKAIEDGKITFPEEFTRDGLEEMAENDWWTYVTQYLNDPQEAGLAEFTNYNIKVCELDYDNESKQYWIIIRKEGDEIEAIALSNCDVIICVDPASTEKATSAKTSRTAMGVVATDHLNRKFLIHLKADYITAVKLYDWLFDAARKFKNYFRATYLETNGPYKMLAPLIRAEENKRQEWLGLRPFQVVGEKIARIRSTLDPVLSRNQVYVLKENKLQFEEEMRAFPQSKKKDILDMFSSAVVNSTRPLNEMELSYKQMADEEFANRTATMAGY